MRDFLPEDYKLPETSNYMKFEDGANTFRILSSAIIGMEFWKQTEDGKKPIRRKMDEHISLDELEIDKDGNLIMPKHFWAFVVYNRKAEKVQILEITQKGIQKAIKSLIDSPKWGNPKEYDITITREGAGFDTEYSVMPEPKEELDKGIAKLYKDMGINLEALYKGDDPFTNTSSSDLAQEVAGEIPF